MIRKLYWLVFGYIELIVNTEDICKIVSICLKNGIKMTLKDGNKIILLHRDFDIVLDEFKNNSVNYDVIKEYFGLNISNKRKSLIAVAATVIFTLSTIFFMSNLIWDIDIQGNEKISNTMILTKLDKCGLKIGQLWFNIDYGEIESELLDTYADIAWVSVNRRGSVAYISVIEADRVESNQSVRFEYSNIVASEDCVIEEIDVYLGTPLVKVGDSVKKGDVLILGITNNQDESTFCSAEGRVVGRVNKKITTYVDRKQQAEKDVKPPIYSLKVKIFDFSINIFKKYRNFEEECDIIEKKEKIAIFGKRKLPIEIIRQYKVFSSFEDYEASDEELIQKASYQMRAIMHNMLHDVSLNSLKTYGEFMDEGYTMISEVVYSCNVANDIEFFLEEK